MAVRLMNAAVMPVEGKYDLHRVTDNEFAQLIQFANSKRTLQSYIGYPEAARILTELCGIPIPLNRESTPVEDGDILLIARLKYRVGNPAAKGQVVATLDDYEFFECGYEAFQTKGYRRT